MLSPMARLRRSVRDGRSDAPGRLVDALGRIGLVGYGLVHVLVAWLALQIAFGVSNAPADPGGAVGTIARTPGGAVLLALAAVGLTAFVVWQLTAAAIGFRWVQGGERFRKRVGATAKSIACGALAGLALASLFGAPSGDGDTGVRQAAADLLLLPAGRVLLGVAALVVLFLAAAMTYTGVRRTFLGDLDLRRTAPAMRRTIEVIGAVGHLARALALGVVGVLAASAALFADPRRAGGLDAALRLLGSTTSGAVLLVVVAAGFAAFGVFCLVDAATRRA